MNAKSTHRIVGIEMCDSLLGVDIVALTCPKLTTQNRTSGNIYTSVIEVKRNVIGVLRIIIHCLGQINREAYR